MENDSPYYRHTKIIVTLGPATESDEQLARLIGAGVDVIRLNMAHATVQWVGEVVGRIRQDLGRDGASRCRDDGRQGS